MSNTTNQPYITWKGTSTNAITSTFSHPLAQGQSNLSNYTSAERKARPLKHWRKQLNPNTRTTRRNVSIDQINKPGGFIYLGVSSTDCPTCNDSSNNTSTFKINIPSSKNNNYTVHKTIYTDTSNNIYGKCINYHQDLVVIKSAQTNISNKYFSSTKSYLQSRCKTYQQKLSINKKDGVTYLDANGNLLHPSDSPTGPQVFNTSNCPLNCSTETDNVTTIYKKSNRNFSVDGAVSSSTRLAKLKYDTITKNGASFRSAYGEQAANAGKYHGDNFSPYFIKNKSETTICKPYNRNGSKTACFNLVYS